MRYNVVRQVLTLSYIGPVSINIFGHMTLDQNNIYLFSPGQQRSLAYFC